jgi:hypothetical protein
VRNEFSKSKKKGERIHLNIPTDEMLIGVIILPF